MDYDWVLYGNDLPIELDYVTEKPSLLGYTYIQVSSSVGRASE